MSALEALTEWWHDRHPNEHRVPGPVDLIREVQGRWKDGECSTHSYADDMETAVDALLAEVDDAK